MDSLFEIAKADVRHDFVMAYEKVATRNNPNDFERIMKNTAREIYALQLECTPNINPIESAMLMIMSGNPEDFGVSAEDMAIANEYIRRKVFTVRKHFFPDTVYPEPFSLD